MPTISKPNIGYQLGGMGDILPREQFLDCNAGQYETAGIYAHGNDVKWMLQRAQSVLRAARTPEPTAEQLNAVMRDINLRQQRRNVFVNVTPAQLRRETIRRLINEK